MPTIKFTPNLRRFYPDLSSIEVNELSIPGILDKLNIKYPGIKDYIVDEQGSLRKHVNIFIHDELISDRQKLSDHLDIDDEIYIMQALSGG